MPVSRAACAAVRRCGRRSPASRGSPRASSECDRSHWACRLPRRSSTAVNSRDGDTMATYGKKASDKVEKTMHERKHGTLKSGGLGQKVSGHKEGKALVPLRV